MVDPFLGLGRDDRRDALAAAAGRGLERAPALLEKDVWVVWCLQALFAAPFGAHLVFKGGTSLSKAYDVIERFSEDVDLTYDIRSLVDDPAAGDPADLTASRVRALTKDIRKTLLPDLLDNVIAPFLTERLAAERLVARIERDGVDLLLIYEAAVEYPAYVQPRIKLEFGARSTGEPAEPRDVTCYMAAVFPELSFPQPTPRVMQPARTFWEKATAIHVFCLVGHFRGGAGFARHWYDLLRLETAGFADTALADRDLAKAVADHKSKFFVEKTADDQVIDYYAAVGGGLRLVADGEAYDALAADYAAMVDAGYLEGDTEPFSDLMARCQALQDRINLAMADQAPGPGEP